MNNYSSKTYQIVYKITIIIGCITLAFPLLAHAYNGLFMRLNGDDYCYLAVQSEHGFWGMQSYSYQSESSLYNGERYSLNFALALLGIMGSHLPSIGPGFALLTWFVAWFFAFWQINNYYEWKFDLWEVVLLTETCIFFTLYIAGDVTQILYWYGGMAQYTIPIILNGFLLGLIYLYVRRSSRIILFILIPFSFLIGGFSETPTAVQAIYLFIILMVSLYKYRQSHNEQIRKIFIPLSLAEFGTLLALIALAFSPSTAGRLTISSHPSFSMFLINSLKYGFIFIAQTILSTPLPIFTLFLMTFLLAIAIRYKQNTIKPNTIKTTIVIAVLVAISGYLLIVASMAPSVYAQDAYPGERALLPARFILVLSVISMGTLFGKLMPLSVKSNAMRSAYSFSTLVLIMILLIYPLHAGKKITSYTGFYQKWSTFWDAREKQIKLERENEQRDIHVVNIDHPITDVSELSPNPESWYNVCASIYYGVNSITADLQGWDK